jgi:predicted amidohydrolase
MTADMIIINGNFITFADENPNANACAIKDGHILAVGETADMHDLADMNTQIIDAGNIRFYPASLIAMSIYLVVRLSWIILTFMALRASTI